MCQLEAEQQKNKIPHTDPMVFKETDIQGGF